MQELRTDGDHGYRAMAARMEDAAAQQAWFLGIEAAREGLGVTVSYWTDDAAGAAGKQVAEHVVAQQRGRDAWYADYQFGRPP